MTDQKTTADVAPVTLDVIADRLSGAMAGMSLVDFLDQQKRRELVVRSLTGLPPGLDRDDRVADILACLARPADTRGDAAVAVSLDWEELETDRGDGTSEPSGDHNAYVVAFNIWYQIRMGFGSDSYCWEATCGDDHLGTFDDLGAAKACAQADFQRRVRSVPAAAPTPPAPVALVEAVRVESVTALLIDLMDGGSLEWADAYVQRAKVAPHAGDCPHAEHPAPITCDRCVWEEYSAKARQIIAALAQPSAPPAGNQRPRTLIDQLEERFGPGSIAAWDGSDEKAIVGAAAPAGSDLLPGLEEVIRIINDHTLWRDVSSLVQAIRDCARAAGIEQPAASGTVPDKGEALRVAVVPSKAAQDVFEERLRQVEVEGWTLEHDDTHDEGQIARAALNYVAAATIAMSLGAESYDHVTSPPLDNMGYAIGFPWGREAWKPGPVRRMLVKAGALIVVEIERLDRRAALDDASRDGSEDAK